MLVKAVGISDSITTKELANYSAENYEYVYGTLSKMGKIVEKFEIESGIIDEKKANIVKKWRQSFTGYLIMTFVIFWLIISIFAIGLFIIATLVISFIGSIACARAHWKNITKLGEFSEKGTLYKHQWLGLKKYMEDYSLLKEGSRYCFVGEVFSICYNFWYFQKSYRTVKSCSSRNVYDKE